MNRISLTINRFIKCCYPIWMAAFVFYKDNDIECYYQLENGKGIIFMDVQVKSLV
jgi:hypothetical protein